MRYDVKTHCYEGPLPLLVELAKLNLIDVLIIKLQALTKEYAERVSASGIDLNDLAEPLPLFGNLLALKARQLLPKPELEEEEEVPISMEELEKRLREYEQFKTVAELLSELHALEQQHFTRLPDEQLLKDTKPEPSDPFDVGVNDLLGALQKALARATSSVYEVRAEAWTVEMKTIELTEMVKTRGRVRFFDIFSDGKSRLELVVTFLALLELIRQRIVHAFQETPFSDIEIGYLETNE